MRDQLISYVDLLFAGAEHSGDMKDEILQNTLDRYDDLLSQGKSPQAAYSLAISGIGDISELLQNTDPAPEPQPAAAPIAHEKNRKLMHAAAIGMYICCPIPIIALSSIDSTIGVALMFLLIAAATVLIILAGDGKKESKPDCGCKSSRKNPMRKAVDKIVTTVGLCIYFLVSFATGAWYITWLIFPIMAATERLINAIMDLKEGK